jgi:hypothetical protein
LMPLDEHRLLDSIIKELPEILTGFGGSHGSHGEKKIGRIVQFVKNAFLEAYFFQASLHILSNPNFYNFGEG